MKFACVAIFIIACFLVQSNGQVHYVPAQVLVPVYNTSVFRPLNNTVYNNSYPNYGWNHNVSQTNYGWNPQVPPKPSYGWNGPNYAANPNRPYYGRNNSTVNITTPEGNLLVGTIGVYDRLLFTKEYIKSSRWWSSRDKVIEYPKDLPSGYLRHETISAIRIYNHLHNPKKARAQILEGGVGRQFVKIKLSSDWNNGFKFLVQIYGH